MGITRKISARMLSLCGHMSLFSCNILSVSYLMSMLTPCRPGNISFYCCLLLIFLSKINLSEEEKISGVPILMSVFSCPKKLLQIIITSSRSGISSSSNIRTLLRKNYIK